MHLVTSKRALLPAALFSLLAASAAACGSDDDPLAATGGPDPDAGSTADAADAADTSAPDAADASRPDADADADADVPACDSPIAVALDPAGKTKATAALVALAPDATLEWSDARGTLTSISGLTVSPACAGADDAFDKLFDYLEASPDLFQIDRNEWKVSGPIACSSITGFQPLTIRREKYGAEPLHNDVFTAVADVKDGVVIFRNFSGTYIPHPSAAMLQKLADCHQLTEGQAAAKIRAVPFDYTVFATGDDALPCTFASDGHYTAAISDLLTFDPATELFWEETPAL
ncbi:MAG: repeat domain protein, partial [Labilithrix sp.]|nr:repeat domain protein [Labilithrix sp.]